MEANRIGCGLERTIERTVDRRACQVVVAELLKLRLRAEMVSVTAGERCQAADEEVRLEG